MRTFSNSGMRDFSQRLLLFVFLSACFLPSIWYKSQGPKNDKFAFIANEVVSNFVFKNQPVSESVKAILRTTNLFNGEFVDGAGKRISVFKAIWDNEVESGAGMFQHTPDICWVGQGFEIASFENERNVLVQCGDTILEFQCAVFKANPSSFYELVFWAGIIDGRGVPLDRTHRLDLFSSNTAGGLWLNKLINRIAIGISVLRGIINHPYNPKGERVFIRISTNLDGDLDKSIEVVIDFVSDWIHIQRNRPAEP